METRVPLYERLPEIYHLKDAEQNPPYQLKAYLSLVEESYGILHENIEALYHDLFIETCHDWVIPYIGDLLGTSHLKGDPWTLRADVADTIALRRRKGTKASIERLTYNLTKWGVHCVELRENLVWTQHLNHQRPDAGGDPPYAALSRFAPIRGGTVTLRDPALLGLIGTPFDPFAHVVDVRPPGSENVRHNLPNLAIFLWRLEDYRVTFSKPVSRGIQVIGAPAPGEANRVVRFDLHPLGEPVRLFNTYQFDPQKEPPVVTELDRTPGPIHVARLGEGAEAGRPEAYVAVDVYDPSNIDLETLKLADVGLQFHVPEPEFTGQTWPDSEPKVWSIRGENLCAWETGVQPPVKNREIVIDPEIGRVVIGVGNGGDAAALEQHLFISYTYGAVGSIGAHPISRKAAPTEWQGEAVILKEVDFPSDPNGLHAALDNIQDASSPVVVEIKDSMTHRLDIAAIAGRMAEDGGFNLRLNKSLIIRATGGQRPVIKLARPLRFRPLDVMRAADLTLRFEGLYLTRDESFPTGEPLIARAALDGLELINCTLDPGGYRQLDSTRAPIHPSLRLRQPYGFSAADEAAFDQTPIVTLCRCISGPLLIDRGYHLYLTESLLDAGQGIGDASTSAFAVTNASDPVNGWGPPIPQVSGLTVFGRMRVESIDGRGGIWVHALEVLNNQKGCIRYSYFSGEPEDRLPQHLGCVTGTEAKLHFVSEVFGSSAYGQLAHSSDFRVKERGPNDDAMGAFGFLLDAHKWRNVQIRYREFMPVGVKPLFIPVT